jgi:hypothetical protein
MAESEGLSRFLVRAKQPEDWAATAKAQAREQLEQAVQEAGESTQRTAEKLLHGAPQASDVGSAG